MESAMQGYIWRRRLGLEERIISQSREPRLQREVAVQLDPLARVPDDRQPVPLALD